MTMLVDGFDEALIGYGHQYNRMLAIYDYQMCVAILVDRDGMSDEEAEEYMQHNVIKAWMGETTPVFLNEDLGVQHDD